MIPLPTIHNPGSNTNTFTLLALLLNPQIILLSNLTTTIRNALPETIRTLCVCREKQDALRIDIDARARGDVAGSDVDAALSGGLVALVVVLLGGDGGAGRAGGCGGLGGWDRGGEDGGEEGEREDCLGWLLVEVMGMK
ncbi:hypothetical protein OCU04_004911 [Sclerotinia nivalis]|uniref:Uncharacterized protein n=1 Tax=Sclerotinia nivalis TaxID=352851 RepID=A0A9X0ARG2_9HELO|nr:hypothetical protein OCU04_004911 [Sclerotinia nivalis]